MLIQFDLYYDFRASTILAWLCLAHNCSPFINGETSVFMHEASVENIKSAGINDVFYISIRAFFGLL